MIITLFRVPNIMYKNIVGRVFASGPKDQSSIPGRVIPKTQRMVLYASLPDTLYYKVQIKCKWGNAGKGVAHFPTPRCSSYRNICLRVVQLNLAHCLECSPSSHPQLRSTKLYIYIYIYMYISVTHTHTHTYIYI